MMSLETPPPVLCLPTLPKPPGRRVLIAHSAELNQTCARYLIAPGMIQLTTWETGKTALSRSHSTVRKGFSLFKSVIIPHTYSPVGSAIYVFFFTVPRKVDVSETRLNITLDAHPAGVFDFVPGPTDDYRYNVSVYSNSSIANGQHIIVLSTAGAAPGVLEFDYAIYSFVYDRMLQAILDYSPSLCQG